MFGRATMRRRKAKHAQPVDFLMEQPETADSSTETAAPRGAVPGKRPAVSAELGPENLREALSACWRDLVGDGTLAASNGSRHSSGTTGDTTQGSGRHHQTDSFGAGSSGGGGVPSSCGGGHCGAHGTGGHDVGFDGGSNHG